MLWLSWTRNIELFIYTKLCKNNVIPNQGIWFGLFFCCWPSNISAFPNPGQTFKALSHQSSSQGLTNNSSSRIGQGPGRRPRGIPATFTRDLHYIFRLTCECIHEGMEKFQARYLMKILITTPPSPCLVTMARQELTQGQQTSATTHPTLAHQSTAEVHWHFNT